MPVTPGVRPALQPSLLACQPVPTCKWHMDSVSAAQTMTVFFLSNFVMSIPFSLVEIYMRILPEYTDLRALSIMRGVESIKVELETF